MNKDKNIEDTFFLDIFNNILNYNNKNVIIIFDIYDIIWFSLKDLLKILGYSATLKQLSILNIHQDF
jgi:prophage antirepressor-like protein